MCQQSIYQPQKGAGITVWGRSPDVLPQQWCRCMRQVWWPDRNVYSATDLPYIDCNMACTSAVTTQLSWIFGEGFSFREVVQNRLHIIGIPDHPGRWAVFITGVGVLKAGGVTSFKPVLAIKLPMDPRKLISVWNTPKIRMIWRRGHSLGWAM